MSIGTRRGEICAITYEDIDLKKKVIYIKNSLSKSKSKGEEMKGPKTKSGIRAIDLNNIAVEFLEKHLKEQKRLKKEFGASWQNIPNIFTDGPNGAISLNSISNSWRRFLKNHKLKYVSLKGLRTSFATYLAHQGMPPKELQTIMGHSSYRVTMEYYQVAYDNYTQTMLQYTNDIGNK